MLTTSRKEWKARPPKRPYAPLPKKVKGIKWHYTGGFVSPDIVDNHQKCLEMIRSFQNHHMDGNGWNDFAYNYAVCPHEVIIGRGMKVMSSANGNPTLNKGHYAVLLLVGSSGLTVPPDSMLEQACDLKEHIRTHGPCGNELKGHKDGYATSCPGAPVYKWVQAGCPRPKKEEEDCHD